LDAVNLLRDTRGTLVDAARNFRVQWLAMESVAQHGLLIGAFLGVSTSRFRFGAHALIFAFLNRGSMLVVLSGGTPYLILRWVGQTFLAMVNPSMSGQTLTGQGNRGIRESQCAAECGKHAPRRKVMFFSYP
jgi:hypothetical protein